MIIYYIFDTIKELFKNLINLLEISELFNNENDNINNSFICKENINKLKNYIVDCTSRYTSENIKM